MHTSQRIMPWAGRQAGGGAGDGDGCREHNAARQNRNTFHAVLPLRVLLGYPIPLPLSLPAFPLSVRHEFSINYAKMFVVFALFLRPLAAAAAFYSLFYSNLRAFFIC